MSRKNDYNITFSPTTQDRIRKTVNKIFSIEPQNVVDMVRSSHLKNHIWSKYADPSPDTAEYRKNNAIQKLLAMDKHSSDMNWSLKFERPSVQSVSREAVLYTARQICSDILGRFELSEWFSRCEFSGGASISKRRREAHIYEKFDGTSSVSNTCLPLLVKLHQCSATLQRYFLHQQLAAGGWQVSDVNSVFTVPKNEETDRAACKEPDWNMFFQKGLGSMIRHRLLKQGIDLNDQSRNRALAKAGSLDGALATLDMSSASDSICSGLVELLLPAEWFNHLSMCRSSMGVINDGKPFKWHLWSTMGNGFTFELESLIFFSLARACAYHFGVKGTISIYGDDLIIPTLLSNNLISMFQLCGFIVNRDKSFTAGFFRESCGGHYYFGFDVTPFYIKGPLTLHDLVNLINKFKLWSSGGSGCIDPRYSGIVRELESFIKPSLLKRIKGGPVRIFRTKHMIVESLPDSYIIGDGWSSYVLERVNTRKHSGSIAAYLSALKTVTETSQFSDNSNDSIIMLSKRKYRNGNGCWLIEPTNESTASK